MRAAKFRGAGALCVLDSSGGRLLIVARHKKSCDSNLGAWSFLGFAPSRTFPACRRDAIERPLHAQPAIIETIASMGAMEIPLFGCLSGRCCTQQLLSWR